MSGREELLIYAHRGASRDYPENSLAAFRGAVSQGADAVELDVRRAADGTLIVHHDPWYLDQRIVWSTPGNERPSGVPVLADALDACLGTLVNVEIKNIPGDLGGDDVPWSLDIVDALVDLIARRRTAGVTDDLVVSSFDFETLSWLRSRDPGLPTAYLVFETFGRGLDHRDGGDAAARAAEGGAGALHPWDPDVDAALVEHCHRLGLAVNVWTVDDPDRIRALAALGVDGIVTNVPALARAALDERRVG